MKIPTQLKVGGHIYRLEVGGDPLERYLRERHLAGESQHREGRMLLATRNASGQPVARSHVEETFLHELLHAVDVVYNARALSEETVMRLSEGLYQVLNDNKLLR